MEDINMTGTIKFFRHGKYKPFGFISTDYGKDYYFNLAGMKDQRQLPKSGDRVRFEVENSLNGLKATEVEILV
jgi:cold shock CspA family protein